MCWQYSKQHVKSQLCQQFAMTSGTDGKVVSTSPVVHTISYFTREIGILKQKMPLHIIPNYTKSCMKRQNFCSSLSVRKMSPLYNPGEF